MKRLFVSALVGALLFSAVPSFAATAQTDAPIVATATSPAPAAATAVASVNHRSCEAVTASVDYSLQAWDLVDTYRGFTQRSEVEVDPLASWAAGPKHTSIGGITTEGLAFDAAMIYITRRSKTERCAWQALDALGHLSAIFYSHGWRLQTQIFGRRF